jgi:hypothetical protein
VIGLLLGSSLTTNVVGAHDLGTTITVITLGEQTFEIRMECDLDALALGAGAGADDAELRAALETMEPRERDDLVAGLANLFARRVRLLAGDDRLTFEVDFPDRAAGDTLGMEPPTFLGLTARLRGTLPQQRDALRLRLSRAFPDAELTVLLANGDILLEEVVPRGEDSSHFDTTLATVPDDAASNAVAGAWLDPRWLLAAAAALVVAFGLWRNRGQA